MTVGGLVGAGAVQWCARMSSSTFYHNFLRDEMRCNVHGNTSSLLLLLLFRESLSLESPGSETHNEAEDLRRKVESDFGL
jgi:hypothetical protein